MPKRCLVLLFTLLVPIWIGLPQLAVLGTAVSSEQDVDLIAVKYRDRTNQEVETPAVVPALLVGEWLCPACPLAVRQPAADPPCPSGPRLLYELQSLKR